MPSIPFVLPQPLNLTPLAASGNSNAISLPPRSANMAVTFHIKFTLGSLTNASFAIQGLNPDGVTWGNIIAGGATVVGTGTITASGNYAVQVLVPGVKQCRVAYTSSGTVTGSAVIIDATVQQ